MSCGPGSSNAAKFAIIKPYLNLFSPSSLGSLPIVSNLGNGTEQVQVNANSPAREDYVVGRYDWTLLHRFPLRAVSLRQRESDRALL